jgi:hypothetical protein
MYKTTRDEYHAVRLYMGEKCWVSSGLTEVPPRWGGQVWGRAELPSITVQTDKEGARPAPELFGSEGWE